MKKSYQKVNSPSHNIEDRIEFDRNDYLLINRFIYPRSLLIENNLNRINSRDPRHDTALSIKSLHGTNIADIFKFPDEWYYIIYHSMPFSSISLLIWGESGGPIIFKCDQLSGLMDNLIEIFNSPVSPCMRTDTLA